MKKGFTLIELMAIIIVLGIIVTLSFASLTTTLKKSELKKIDTFNSELESAAQIYLETTGKYKEVIPGGSTYIVRLNELISLEYIKSNIENPTECINDNVIVEVTKDLDNVLTYETSCDNSLKLTSSNFSSLTWDVIVSSIQAGNYDSSVVGATKAIDLGSLGIHTLKVVNISSPTECSNPGFSMTACGFVLAFDDSVSNSITHSNSKNAGSWPSSNIREYVNATVYNALPAIIKNNIIDTTVVTGYGKQPSERDFTSTDKLYLFSPGEIWMNSNQNDYLDNDTASNKTRLLDFYVDRQLLNEQNTTIVLRTPNHSTDDSYYALAANGRPTTISASTAAAISPAFRLR